MDIIIIVLVLLFLIIRGLCSPDIIQTSAQADKHYRR